MAKQVGDNLKSSITRAGFTNVQIVITRATPPGAETETLLPCGNGAFVEEEVTLEGLDGSQQLLYHQFDIDLDYYQTDAETLADLKAAALDSQFRITGVSTILTFKNGMTKTLTLKWKRKVVGGGYNSALVVQMHGRATYDTSIFA